MIRWINILVLLGCAGCASPERILNSDGVPMVERMRQVNGSTINTSEQRDASNARYSQSVSEFERSNAQANIREYAVSSPELLPNPTITIYVYPHMATRFRAPVPGYRTKIKLYARDEFALPGEYRSPQGAQHVR